MGVLVGVGEGIGVLVCVGEGVAVGVEAGAGVDVGVEIDAGVAVGSEIGVSSGCMHVTSTSAASTKMNARCATFRMTQSLATLTQIDKADHKVCNTEHQRPWQSVIICAQGLTWALSPCLSCLAGC